MTAAAGSIDAQIARAATLRPIEEIAARLDIPPAEVFRFGPYKAKIALPWLQAQVAARPKGRLILVTAISPTPAGEGKTTTTIGLGDALARLGHRTAIALREPSLGPCMGMKGGATGGGRAQVAPSDDINLHFTGDFHAVSTAHNLLAALLDNHMYWGNALALDARRILFRRVVDMNDRALRQIVVGLGTGNGVPRETGYDITVASEVMAIFCLSRSLAELEERLGRMTIARKAKRGFILARELNATGAMAALLKDALAPNLVQTLEGTPTFIHGGPFANIAHGCNSVIATEGALALANFVVTEAGFGADLGAEKFIDIKCRQSGLAPAAAVIVATVRALKFHGGVKVADLAREDAAAVERGAANLTRHVANMKRFGMPVFVALNRFTGDSDAERAAVLRVAEAAGAPVFDCAHWAEGGAGAEALARAVAEAPAPGPLQLLYPDAMPLIAKIETIAREMYGAKDIVLDPVAQKTLAEYEAEGFGHLPICIAKTQYSFSANPEIKGAPTGHTLPVREVQLSAGAGFVVAICGTIMRMPGLPREPASDHIRVGPDGSIDGLF